MRREIILWTVAAALPGAAAAGEAVKSKQNEVLLRLGDMTLRPYGFLDSIGMVRSATTPDSVSTRFGRVPLAETSGESLATLRHSRLMLKAEKPLGTAKAGVYLESDFMNFTPGRNPYRWRQYWGQVQIGKWEVLGGQAWSLLRPNRSGVSSDKNVMNTDVVDPAYHVGLLGSRRRQVRVARSLGAYKAAVAWEAQGSVVGKLVRDGRRSHFEVGGLSGRHGRRGVTGAGVLPAGSRARIVFQQYWGRRAADEALGVLPAGVNGFATIQGTEVQVARDLEVYGYAGLVYGARSADNRLVWQWSAGFTRKVAMTPRWSAVTFSAQYSRIDRSVWDGRSGRMDYLMCRIRYSLN